MDNWSIHVGVTQVDLVSPDVGHAFVEIRDENGMSRASVHGQPSTLMDVLFSRHST